MNQAQEATASTEATIEVRWPRTGIAQVVLGGEHDLSTVNQLEKTLTETLGGCSRLIVDLRRTQLIDSATILTLLSTKGRADASNRDFNILLATTPIVEKALEITGALPALNRLHTLKEALSLSNELRARLPRRAALLI